MTRLVFTLLFLVNALNSLNAYAAEQECDAAALKVIADYLNVKDFYLHDFETNAGVIVSAACKAAPQDPNITLAAVGYSAADKKTLQSTANQESDTDNEKELIVAMLDNTSKHILSIYKSTMYEDAVVEVYRDSLRLDTAAYQLAPKVRAFGLRFDSGARGASCPDAWQRDDLQLFVRNGAKLRPVFAAPMSQSLAKKGCANAGASMETLVEEASLTIKVLKSKTNGYADLMLSALISTDGSDPVAQTIKPRVEHEVMHYDGEKYVTNKKDAPWWLGTNWALQ